MTDTDATYETPDDIAAETAERAACADTDNPVAPVDPFEPGSLGWLLPWAETGEGNVLTPDEALELAYGMKGKDASVVVIPDGVAVLAVKE